MSLWRDCDWPGPRRQRQCSQRRTAPASELTGCRQPTHEEPRHHPTSAASPLGMRHGASVSHQLNASRESRVTRVTPHANRAEQTARATLLVRLPAAHCHYDQAASRGSVTRGSCDALLAWTSTLKLQHSKTTTGLVRLQGIRNCPAKIQRAHLKDTRATLNGCAADAWTCSLMRCDMLRLMCLLQDVMMGHAYGAWSGCAGCAVRLCVWGSSDCWLVAREFDESVLIPASTLWLLPFTLL